MTTIYKLMHNSYLSKKWQFLLKRLSTSSDRPKRNKDSLHDYKNLSFAMARRYVNCHCLSIKQTHRQPFKIKEIYDFIVIFNNDKR